jgi:hypothetical protein
LRQFRARFGALLGTIQEDPTDGPAVEHTAQMLALVAGDSSQRIDARSYLVARIFDFFLNDWDRHPDQWRWVPEPTGGGILWRPIPVDRDQAFSWYDGLLMDLARLRSPKLARFGPTYPPIKGLVHNAEELDHRILGGLDRPAWDSAARFVATRMTDAAIDEAVHSMPKPYWDAMGSWMVGVLRLRRDQIPMVTDRFYGYLHPGQTVYTAGRVEARASPLRTDLAVAARSSRKGSTIRP